MAVNRILLNPVLIVRTLGTAAFLIVLASTVSCLSAYIMSGPHCIYSPLQLLEVNYEQNIPTFFSVFLLLLATGLLFIIAALEKKQTVSLFSAWTYLSLVFFCWPRMKPSAFMRGWESRHAYS